MLKHPLHSRGDLLFISVMCSAISFGGRQPYRHLIRNLHTQTRSAFSLQETPWSVTFSVKRYIAVKRFKLGAFDKSRYVAAATKLQKQVSLLACRWYRAALWYPVG